MEIDVTDEMPWAGQAAFIIGPIGNALDPRGTPGRNQYEESLQMWEQVFEPACEELGLLAIRADKIADPGEITEQIFVHLRDSPVVIADVTEGNPNVMYELGLRHTRDLVTVQIGEYARLPFDITTIRTRQFRRTEGGLIEVRGALIDSLRAGLERRGTPVTATRVWNQAESVAQEVISAAAAASNAPEEETEVDEPGIVDVLAEGEAGVLTMTAVLERASADMQSVGSLSTEFSERVAESDRNRGGFAGRLRLVRELSEELKTPAGSLEEEAVEFNEEVAKVDAMMRYIIERAGEKLLDPDEKAQLHSFLRSVLQMIDAAEGSEAGIRKMLAGATSLRKFARDLAPIAKALERALNQFLRGIAVISEWRSPIHEVLEEEDPE